MSVVSGLVMLRPKVITLEGQRARQSYEKKKASPDTMEMSNTHTRVSLIVLDMTPALNPLNLARSLSLCRSCIK